jgi:hypothetical protein
MPDRLYHSVRTGKNPLAKGFGIEEIRDLFQTVFIYFEDNGYFQESLGYYCVDQDFVAGTCGHELKRYLLLKLRKKDLSPIRERIVFYTEDDLFDVIEFLHDYCSYPLEGVYHSWNQCGIHYSTFDKEKGQQEYREKTNEILKLYESGYELSSEGEVLILPDNALGELIENPLPKIAQNKNLNQKIEDATRKFRRSRSSMSERRDAIRDLADVFESIRPDLKKSLHKQGEQDLFNIVNNFDIRHNNKIQKPDYDKSIWYSWMFHYYLATIHAALRLIEKNKDCA